MQQSNSLDFKLVQRVCLLQQALDQALESLDELKAQVQDKQWIETQLASTEKYANVQQQAITQLKQQLTQFTEVQEHLLKVMSYRLNELIDQQQQAFNHLNVRFQQSHTELQTYLRYLGQQQPKQAKAKRCSEEYGLELEAEVMVARSMAVHLSQYLSLAQQQLDKLNQDLSNHHLSLGYIIKTTQAMITELNPFDQTQSLSCLEIDQVTQEVEAILPMPESPIGEVELEDGEPDVGTLQANLRRQTVQIQELQALLKEHAETETYLRQRYQAIAVERDYFRRELEKLKQSMAQNACPLSSAPDGEVDAGLLSPPPMPFPQGRRRSRPSQPIQPLQIPKDPEG